MLAVRQRKYRWQDKCGERSSGLFEAYCSVYGLELFQGKAHMTDTFHSYTLAYQAHEARAYNVRQTWIRLTLCHLHIV